MSDAIKVLVVDDAVVIRMILRKTLSEDPDIEVVDVASNGRIALRMLEKHELDMVLLDVEMPEMNGLETLREIRKDHKELPVIMFSGHTEKAAKSTIEAMAAGATDYIAKPQSSLGEDHDEVIREQLIPTIKSVCRGEKIRPAPIGASGEFCVLRPRSLVAQPGPIKIVAIGTSTGGPNALAEVVAQLPADLPVPVLIVQHMPPNFTRQLAVRLDRLSALSVSEASPGAQLEAGNAWLAPGGFHMVLEQRDESIVLQTNRGPKEHFCRPAVDPLMRSVAAYYGSNSLAVILTGMGSDGLEGCSRIREAGGRILIQDEDSSVVWGMPGHVSQAGLADGVFPLDQIGPTIARWCNSQPLCDAELQNQTETRGYGK